MPSSPLRLAVGALLATGLAVALLDEPAAVGQRGAPVPAGPPLRAEGPLSIVYDLAPIAARLYAGDGTVGGLAQTARSARQFPLGEPFPPERHLGKVNRTELEGRSAAAMAAALEAGTARHRLGTIASGFVALDEVGIDFTDDADGPRLLAAMRQLAARRYAPTGEPLSRRVIMYVAPGMVSAVGSGNGGRWTSALAAARLSGGAYLQMYHAADGRVTGPFTASEWSDYLPVWRAAMGPERRRLRVILSNGRGVSQAEQWRRALQTPAGRLTLRNGVGAYKLETAAEATQWLVQWNRYAR